MNMATDPLEHIDENKPSVLQRKNFFFIGIGGIGMSALARYFNAQGKYVAGYDRTKTALTDSLEHEGILVHYEDNPELIPDNLENNSTLVVYTPAIPTEHKELNYFQKNQFEIRKRSEVLGEISGEHLTVAVAGTHGKTTTSTMITHIFNTVNENCMAFLGGISSNLNSNLLLAESEFDAIMVAEADEFDRSFLKLSPDIAIITSVEADHLDIYGESDNLKSSFKEFSQKIPEDGTLICQNKFAADFKPDYTYGLENGDYHASNIRIENEKQYFDAVTPTNIIPDLVMNQPGYHNIENALAAIIVAQMFDIPNKKIREAFSTYKGVKRRFEYIIERPNLIYIDDYAHHPTEIRSLLNSVRNLYPEKKITIVFQPHLYSRTRDFANGFSESLNLADFVVLCPIYPAREEPIEGINSELLLKGITKPNQLIQKEDLAKELSKMDLEVLLTVGAGDIDKEIEPIKSLLLERYEKTIG